MEREKLTRDDVEIANISGHFCPWVVRNGKVYVIAKSVVIAVTGTVMSYQEDPYIEGICSLADGVIYFAISGKELVHLVWPENRVCYMQKVVFIEKDVLIRNMETLFSDINSSVVKKIKIELAQIASSSVKKTCA